MPQRVCLLLLQFRSLLVCQSPSQLPLGYPSLRGYLYRQECLSLPQYLFLCLFQQECQSPLACRCRHRQQFQCQQRCPLELPYQWAPQCPPLFPRSRRA
mmetsp:Transcript_9434/g.23955  ORF Transcript_9434/g.23955 Transcript_9434/m.23955 type:complete len:99 (-) Transcript_9434:155-451(-)